MQMVNVVRMKFFEGKECEIWVVNVELCLDENNGGKTISKLLFMYKNELDT